jgi:hypothetical protein
MKIKQKLVFLKMALINLQNQTALTEATPRVKYGDREDKIYWGCLLARHSWVEKGTHCEDS